jgi:hypothetical protein
MAVARILASWVLIVDIEICNEKMEVQNEDVREEELSCLPSNRSWGNSIRTQQVQNKGTQTIDYRREDRKWIGELRCWGNSIRTRLTKF